MNKKELLKLTRFFQTLSDPTRVRILRFLASGMADKKNGKELAKMLDITPSAVSQHLRIFKDVGIIEPYREGSSVYYKIDVNKLSEYKKNTDRMFEVIFDKCNCHEE